MASDHVTPSMFRFSHITVDTLPSEYTLTNNNNNKNTLSVC